MKKLEGNIIIAITAMRDIMDLFLGPFLTTYFIKTSQESITDLSIYYIFSYLLLALGSFLIASIIKRKFRIGMFRLGIILNYLYILTIIILKENIVNHLLLISLLYGISCSAYWFPYNLFVINRIDNPERTEFTVRMKTVSSIVGILCPIILGSIITVTNYELTAIIILLISIIQIILSFILMPEKKTELEQFNPKKTWELLRNNAQIKKMCIVEFFTGMNISGGALKILITILIFQSFKTNMNLGIITSITTIISMIMIKIYGKIYKNKSDKNIIVLSSILPILSVIALLLFKNNITVILYNICYVVFATLLVMTKEIRLFNLSNSKIVEENHQSEFFAIREGMLNSGRIIGYTLLLLAGVTGNETLLNLVMILLTLSIFIMGLNITKIEKFEE